jgi:hypothetical protein
MDIPNKEVQLDIQKLPRHYSVGSSGATDQYHRPTQSEKDEAPPLKKSKAQQQMVQGAMSGMQMVAHMRLFSSSHDNTSDMVHQMMDISDFATDNGPFQLEEGQIPPSASTAGMVQ